ncbi:MAG: aromatic-ring-hydroxylating dioxygenase subunit beta [Alphaproteobacteria bacterium]
MFTSDSITRAEVEDFLYEEAALLDRWRLEDWLELLTHDAEYEVPSTDAPLSKTGDALFLIADDYSRIKARVKRLNDPEAHAESPRSRTRRMISNVRITKRQGTEIHVAANFSVYRFRYGYDVRHFVGHYHYTLMVEGPELKIRKRRAILDNTELGAQGAVSFIL